MPCCCLASPRQVLQGRWLETVICNNGAFLTTENWTQDVQEGLRLQQLDTQLHQHRLISEAGVAAAHGGAVSKRMFGLMPTSFTNAGWNRFSSTGRTGFVGWMGLGGSVMQWHPEERIGFGYAMNLLELTPTNERGAALQREVLRCARAVRSQGGVIAAGCPDRRAAKL